MGEARSITRRRHAGAKPQEMIMNFRPTLATAALALSLATPVALQAADVAAGASGAPLAADITAENGDLRTPGSPVVVHDFDVYVDLQTGFAYVKTPTRWTFVRQLDAEQLKRLPPSTLTALRVDGSDGRLLGKRYAQAAPEVWSDGHSEVRRLAL
jgi:hypothetical protein